MNLEILSTVYGSAHFSQPHDRPQVVVALLLSIGFGFASAWYQPYAAQAANIFKAGTEMTLVITLTMVILLRAVSTSLLLARLLFCNSAHVHTCSVSTLA